MANSIIGASLKNLENYNSNVTLHTPGFIEAKKEYDLIINNATDYISRHAPITMLYLGAHAYYGERDLYSQNKPNVIYLSAKSLSSTHSIGEYVSTHKISPMLKYILVTEGWTASSSNNEFTFYVTRNGNPYYG